MNLMLPVLARENVFHVYPDAYPIFYKAVIQAMHSLLIATRM
jgi:hypothetical protein